MPGLEPTVLLHHTVEEEASSTGHRSNLGGSASKIQELTTAILELVAALKHRRHLRVHRPECRARAGVAAEPHHRLLRSWKRCMTRHTSNARANRGADLQCARGPPSVKMSRKLHSQHSGSSASSVAFGNMWAWATPSCSSYQAADRRGSSARSMS